ncbi:MAG: TetR/AcrR family transcriptional regulator [Peptostreptococcaceae bacterium]|nr:TetR/AcrR family transcriptional regulator [Peptostreptococcaceae bacterium]
MIAIYSKFYSLSPEKQERIINAAFKEFAYKGYEQASTNEIVKNSGISKGALFHYFKSKKELYQFLLGQLTEFSKQVIEKTDWSERDFFKRMYQIGITKLELARKTPTIFEFATSLTREDSLIAKEIIDSSLRTITEKGVALMYENIDFSKFREDVDLDKVMKIIHWTLFALSDEESSRIGTLDELGQDMLNEYKEYLDTMQKCFYKSNSDGNI